MYFQKFSGFRILVMGTAFLLSSGGLIAQTTSSQSDPLSVLKADVQRRADRQIYPIAGMKSEDAKEALSNLKSIGGDDWAAAWSAVGERYSSLAERSSQQTPVDQKALKENLRQAWLHYMFAAWPYQNTPGKRTAYLKSIEVFKKYGKTFDPPMEVVGIPFEGKVINAYVQLPKGVTKPPVVISLGGLDEYKEYVAEYYNDTFMNAKLGVIAVDMPGTGESPVKMDLQAERTISAVINYLRQRTDVNGDRLAIQGVSAGGYWSSLMSYTERNRLRAAVVWGGPTHGYFSRDWQSKSFSTQEYLFGLKEARIGVWGFENEQQFLDGISKFSLQSRNLLSQPSTKTLIVNGEKDSQVPIDDLHILARSGTPKYTWVNPVGGHIGRSSDISEVEILKTVITPWLRDQLSRD